MSLARTSLAVPIEGPAARGGIPGLLDSLWALHKRGESGALGIVFATSGSTYQKPGAIVLLDRSGMRHGAISGGCLEPQLEDRARTVCERRVADTVDFDTRSDEDLVFGSGTGCRGRIHVLLVPQAPGAPLTQALSRLADSAEPLDLRLVTEGSQVGSGSASIAGEHWHWGGDGQAVSHSMLEGLLFAGPAMKLRVPAPAQVLLLGSGPEIVPLNLFINCLGWRATCVEHRGRWLRFAGRAGIRHTIELPPEEAAPIWDLLRPDAAVIMTHNYALDLKHLTECAQSDVPYVGLLGPAARRDALLTELDSSLIAQLRGRLHAPVGLGLGGSGPEALALSISAELQQHLTTRPGLGSERR